MVLGCGWDGRLVLDMPELLLPKAMRSEEKHQGALAAEQLAGAVDQERKLCGVGTR